MHSKDLSDDPFTPWHKDQVYLDELHMPCTEVHTLADLRHLLPQTGVCTPPFPETRTYRLDPQQPTHRHCRDRLCVPSSALQTPPRNKRVYRTAHKVWAAASGQLGHIAHTLSACHFSEFWPPQPLAR